MFIPMDRMLTIDFAGATKKHVPFRGWAGPITEWQEKEAPKVSFGKWMPKQGCAYGSGTVTFSAKPFSVIMWGSNGPGMRPNDKTTAFGFAGLADAGGLCGIKLAKDVNARELYAAGGFQPADPEIHTQKIQSFQLQQGPLYGQLQALWLHVIEAMALIGLVPARALSSETDGSHMQQIVDLKKRMQQISEHWPHLLPLCTAIQKKLEEWEAARTVAASQRKAKS